MVSDAANIFPTLFLTLLAKHAVNDYPSSLYDIVEDEDNAGPVILNFVRVFFLSSCSLVQFSNTARPP
jgi:hypothetical protein